MPLLGRAKAYPDHAIHRWLARCGMTASAYAEVLSAGTGVHVSRELLLDWVRGDRCVPESVAQWIEADSFGAVSASMSWARIQRRKMPRYLRVKPHPSTR